MLERHALGITMVGDEVIVVRASASALGAGAKARVSWQFVRVPADAGPDALAPLGAMPPRAARVLVLPLDAMLRREVDSGGQSSEEFRAVAAENLSAFLPLGDAETLMWDAAGLAGGRRVFLGAADGASMEPALARLESLGLSPTRIIPSALAYPLLTLGHAEGGAGVATEGEPGARHDVVERTPTGWSAHRFLGLAWAGSRSGAGEPPESLRSVPGGLDWRAPDPENTSEEAAPPNAVGVALGGALLALWPGIDRHDHPAPEFNLLPQRARRAPLASAFVRWAGVAAALVVGVSLYAQARLARVAEEQASLQAAATEGKSRVAKVESLRDANERLLTAHDRVQKLEATYTPRWVTLSEISRAVPKGSWVETAEIGDDWAYLDVVTSTPADLIQALEAHPALEGVRQATPGAPTENAGETKFRIEARLTRGGTSAPATPAPASPAATEGKGA